MEREKLIKDIERQMSEPTSEYVVLWFSEAEYVLELMKEQEAVKPTILDYSSGRRRAWCGKCGYRVKIGYHGDCTENFCGKCGTPILWEGR